MKRQALFLFLPIFLVFFAWGLQIGNNLKEELPVGSVELQLEQNIKELPNGQKNILIFIVSEIDARQPKLYGIWLMSYLLDEPYATILSIYPSSQEDESAFTNIIADTFKLRKINGITQIDEGFLHELDQKNIWFSGYVLIDLKGFAEMLRLSGTTENPLNATNSESEIEQVLHLNDSSIPVLVNQIFLLQQLCNKFTIVDALSDLDSVRGLYPQHISGNLDPDVLLEDWGRFIKSRNGSFCVFPQKEQFSQFDN